MNKCPDLVRLFLVIADICPGCESKSGLVMPKPIPKKLPSKSHHKISMNDRTKKDCKKYVIQNKFRLTLKQHINYD